MAFKYDAQGRPLNPLTGQPMNVGGSTQTTRATQTTLPGGVTVTGSAPPAQAPQQSGSPSYLANPDSWVQQNYGEGYSAGGGPQTVMRGNGITMTHNTRTPETHPWLFANPGEVGTNGRIYHNADGSPLNYARTGTGYTAGRQASDAERQASYAKNNYFRNGGKGLDPRLMQGMTRTNPNSNQYRNQYGTYNQQHAIIDPARAAAGLDPWVEMRSSFQGRDQQGGAVNYANQNSVWGNRGPGLGGGAYGGGASNQQQALSQALRNPAAGGGTQPPAGGMPPPASGLPGGGTLPGNGTLPGGNNYIGLPPGHGSGNQQAAALPQWWQDMMARRPGAQ